MPGLLDFVMGRGALRKAAGEKETAAPKAAPAPVDSADLLKRNEEYAKERLAKSKAKRVPKAAPKAAPKKSF